MICQCGQWNYSLIKLYDRPFVGCPALRWLTSLLREFERGNNFILYSGRDWEKSANFKELSHSPPAMVLPVEVAPLVSFYTLVSY